MHYKLELWVRKLWIVTQLWLITVFFSCHSRASSKAYCSIQLVLMLDALCFFRKWEVVVWSSFALLVTSFIGSCRSAVWSYGSRGRWRRELCGLKACSSFIYKQDVMATFTFLRGLVASCKQQLMYMQSKVLSAGGWLPFWLIEICDPTKSISFSWSEHHFPLQPQKGFCFHSSVLKLHPWRPYAVKGRILARK